MTHTPEIDNITSTPTATAASTSVITYTASLSVTESVALTLLKLQCQPQWYTIRIFVSQIQHIVRSHLLRSISRRWLTISARWSNSNEWTSCMEDICSIWSNEHVFPSIDDSMQLERRMNERKISLSRIRSSCRTTTERVVEYTCKLQATSAEDCKLIRGTVSNTDQFLYGQLFETRSVSWRGTLLLKCHE